MAKNKSMKTIKHSRPHFLNSTNLQRPVLVTLFVILFGGVGVYFLVGSHAATPYASVNSNSGTLGNGAVAQTDSTASDGTKVVFNGTGSTRTTNCFPSPGACGYPDPAYNNVGSTTPCSSLPSSGSVTVSTSGQTVQNLDIAGTLDISADNVTVKNVCVLANGGDNYDTGPSAAVSMEGNNDTIENSTFGGANDTTQAIQQAIASSGSNDVASSDIIHNCSECIHTSLTVNDSYVAITDATVTGSYGEDHYEDWYFSDDTISANHDTLLNKHDQTAVIFGGSGAKADNHITLTNSLLGGGGYMLYPYGNSSSVGSGTMNISNNRFTRAYYPNGGFYGVDAYIYCGANAQQIWSNNVWDDNNALVQC